MVNRGQIAEVMTLLEGLADEAWEARNSAPDQSKKARLLDELAAEMSHGAAQLSNVLVVLEKVAEAGIVWHD